MATIVFVSPKGGVGKTTSSLLLACALAQSAPVTFIDADPNRPVAAWASAGNKPDNLTVRSDVNEENIIEAIQHAKTQTAFVVVDLEGTAAKIVLLAASQAELVVIPTQGSQLDAEQASKAIKAVRDTQALTGRSLPYAILFTRTNPVIRSRTTSHVGAAFVKNGIPVFAAELNEREAFRAVFSFRTPLNALDPSQVSNLDKAMANVQEFATEVVEKLRAERQARAA